MALLNEMANGTKWIALSLILVEYPEDDLVGKLFAIMSLLPHAMIVSFVTLIGFRRDLHTIVFFSGLIINDCINFVLKQTIRQNRPIHRTSHYSEYGMPSTHAQFIWFFATYAIFFIYFRLNYSCTRFQKVCRTIVAIGCVIIALLVTYSRVYLMYHTYTQVICGALIGSMLGAAWFGFMQTILTPLFPVVVTWRISEFFLIRDTTLIPNVLWFEYTSIRTEARARARKLSAIGRSH